MPGDDDIFGDQAWRRPDATNVAALNGTAGVIRLHCEMGLPGSALRFAVGSVASLEDARRSEAPYLGEKINNEVVGNFCEKNTS